MTDSFLFLARGRLFNSFDTTGHRNNACVCGSSRVEGELNVIFARPVRGPQRLECAINSAPPELDGVVLSEADILTELGQQLTWLVHRNVSGQELTQFNQTSRPLKTEEPTDSRALTQLLAEHRRAIQWIAATTRWATLTTNLNTRLGAAAVITGSIRAADTNSPMPPDCPPAPGSATSRSAPTRSKS